MDMQFQTSLPMDQAIRNLQAAIQEPPLAILDLQGRLHLDGEVKPERVILYRERGRSTCYGQFEGRFTTEGELTHLTGRFAQIRTGGLLSREGFTIALAVSFFVAAAVTWQSRHDFAMIAAAVVAGSVGASTLWFRAKHARVEAELLRKEIAEKLRAPGA
jgi:hypothetical protein